MDYKYISADSHLDLIWTPRGAWQDRVASRWKDQAPKVVESDRGTFWEWEGQLQLASADGRDNAGYRERTFGKRGVETPEGALPPSDPSLLLQHMDLARIYACVIYGNTRKWAFADPDLLKECYRAYNDFLLEMASSAPERIIVLPVLPIRFPEACAVELRRVAGLGAKGVEFSLHDTGVPIYEPAWEPVWEAAEETGLAVCCHIGDKAGAPYPENVHGASKAHFACAPMGSVFRGLAQIIFCGALERHPGLRVSFGECNVGWLPYFVEWMDRQERERPPDPTARLSLKPSEYFARQITVSFEEDVVGARLIGQPWAHLADSAVWGADYPHNAVTWPNPEPVMHRMFDGADPAVRRKAVYERAADFFRLKVPVPAL